MERSVREALEYRGCPICGVLDKDEFDFMADLQYRTIKEEKARQDVILSNGYCNFHFHQMARLASPMGNAVLTKDLIDAEIKEIEGGSFGPILRIECPVCKHADEREEFYVREFGALLSEKSFQKEYEATDGLCRIHLKRVLNLLQGGELHQFVLASHMMHLRLLKVELETFISKVGSTQRDFKAEKNSWLVAIEKMAGKRGLKG
jgi:sarcosine oxidase delta subunit